MRLTAKYFKDYNKKRASFIGKVVQGESNGSSYKVESPCGSTVNVLVPNKIQEPVLGQYVELIGTVQNEDTFMCEDYLVFQPEMTEDFDPQIFAQAVEIEQNYGRKFWKTAVTMETDLPNERD